MNRRGFLSALIAARVAAASAPTAIADPVSASGLPSRVWPHSGIPYDIARKGFEQARQDGDITDVGELTISGASGDEHIRQLARKGAADAIREYNQRLG